MFNENFNVLFLLHWKIIEILVKTIQIPLNPSNVYIFRFFSRNVSGHPSFKKVKMKKKIISALFDAYSQQVQKKFASFCWTHKTAKQKLLEQ